MYCHLVQYIILFYNSKTKRIETLENLCLKKDNFFKKFISDGTKRGDSECARQLASRKKLFLEIYNIY